MASIIATAIAAPVLAADLSFSPSSINATKGKEFSVVVTIDPKNTPIYTVKSEINFPADLLSAETFTFNDTWMQLSQKGYDSIDNKNGILIKSAGYPGGLSSPTVLGTIKFMTKKSGSGTISSAVGSLAFDSSAQNMLSGTSTGTGFTVSETAVKAPTQQASPKIIPQNDPNATTQPTVDTQTQSTEPTQTAVSTLPGQQASILDAFINYIGSSSSKIWLTIMVILAVVLILYAAVSVSKEPDKNT